MNKIVGTFYKGNINRYGLGAWNSIKDDFNQISKSSQIPKIQRESPQDINIFNKSKKYENFSPNSIRMDYYDNQIKQIEDRRNRFLYDYIKNAKYNVYYDQMDPIANRRKFVQDNLEKLRGKLVDEECEKLKKQKEKIVQENKFIDDLIYDNRNKKNDKLEDIFEENDLDFVVNREDNKEVDSVISRELPRKHSILVFSESSSNDSYIREGYLNQPKSQAKRYSTNKSPKKKSRLSKNFLDFQERPHSDIFKIIQNTNNNKSVIDNTHNELFEQTKDAGNTFNDIYYGIKELKKDFNEKMERYKQDTQNKMNIFKEILMMQNINSHRNNLAMIENEEKKAIEKIIDDTINKYIKQKEMEDYQLKIKKEKLEMENDYNLRIKGNERGKIGEKNVQNFYEMNHKTDKFNLNSEIPKEEKFNPNDSFDSNRVTFSGNSRGNIFPALNGIQEVLKNDEYENVEKKKKEKKRVKKNIVVKDLGQVDEGYYDYKDKKFSRKETSFNIQL